jgi:hypothetical protein
VVGRLQVGEELLARSQAQQARARSSGKRHREVGVVPLLGDLLAAAEDAVTSVRVFLSSMMSVAQIIAPASFCTPNATGMTLP